MKAVIYARYSSDSQREESIEGQLRECKEYAERNGITVLSTYIDRALSAKTDNRPDFQRMIKDSSKGLFDIVLVWKLDRFARNRYDSAHYKAILKKNGVKVVSAKEAIAEDSTGILLESLLEGYAEFYSVELSEKIHRGQKENALKGLNNGGRIPLGYVLGKDQRLEIDPITAPIVLEIFTRYAEGETVRAIVESLNERGLQTKRNKPYSMNSFNAILKNRKYIGEYKYQDVVIPGGVPAIVPQELFNRVQERMEKNKRAPAISKADEVFLLTTKLFCGKCGRLMVGESGTSHTGKKHYYYKCGSAKRKTGCTKKAVKKDWIENLVVERTMQMIFDDTTLEAIVGMVLEVQARENTSLPVLKEQLAQAEQGIQNMLNAIQQGIFTPSTKQRLEELEETKERLTVSILQEELQKPRLSKEQILFFLHRFRAIDTTKQKQRQRLIDSFVNAVYVYDDKIILTFNYQDGTETITLDDINGSDLEAECPPSPESEARNSFLKGNGFFVLCGNLNNVQSQAELRKINVEINVQLIVPIDLHPTDQAVDNHFLCLKAGRVVKICPGDHIVVLLLQGVQNGLPFLIGSLCVLKLLLQFGAFGLGLGHHRAQQVFGKGTFPSQGLDDFRFEHIQFIGCLGVVGPDGAEQVFSLLHLFPVAGVDDLAFRDCFHALKDLPHQLVDDPIQDMCRVARLSVTVGLLAGFAIADVPHPLDHPVGIILAGVRLAAGGEVEPSSTMAAVHIPGQERLARDVAGNGALCFIGPVGANPLGRLKQFRFNDLQVGQHRGAAFPVAEYAGIGQVTEDAPNGGVVPHLGAPSPIAQVV